ncbi:hypothetical protein F7R14_28210 [Pseudomonas lini]|uniref:Uncharacterized protein n=1 Tax=Pseudomonas lini TaxID=163011 RepID=A0A7V7NYV8_9PSED|nr:hypothetical protein F7R14_28210 [Pseudomonas lini]
MAREYAIIEVICKPMWERACSRKRLNIQHLCCLTHRFREQARSHTFGGKFSVFACQSVDKSCK